MFLEQSRLHRVCKEYIYKVKYLLFIACTPDNTVICLTRDLDSQVVGADTNIGGVGQAKGCGGNGVRGSSVDTGMGGSSVDTGVHTSVGVGSPLGLGLSLPLAIGVVGVGGVGGEGSYSIVSRWDGSVGKSPACSESSETGDKAVPVVNTGDDATGSLTSGHLGQGVGVGLSRDSHGQGNLEEGTLANCIVENQ